MEQNTFSPGHPQADGHLERAAERAIVSLTAEVRVGRGQWRRVQLHDVSTTGFRIAWLPLRQSDKSIAIRIPGLECLSSTVRWTDMESMGCQFDWPLSVYVFEHLTRMARAQE